MEAIPLSIPDMPDERTMMEKLAVLLKEGIAKPLFQG
jgi:hypothetical protein